MRVLVAVAVLMFPGVVLGQGGQFGSMVGYVYDQTGAPLKGVKITTRSDTQIGGAKVTYSNDEGYFRFPLLEPGVFEVRASAPKLKTQVQKDIKVGITAPAEVTMVLEVETTGVEEVRVVQKPPVVSTTTAHLKEDFDVDFVAAMPLGDRDVTYQQFVNEVGGAVNGSIRGGKTTFTQDGFDLKGQSPTLRSVSAYEISVGGYGAENAMANGGLVNLVSMSGSNKYELNLNASYDSSALRFFTDGGDAAAPTYFYNINPTFSGPIIKDRLWFAYNSETLVYQFGRDKDPNGYLPDPTMNGKIGHKGTVKLTWQVTPRNKLQSLSTFDEFHEWNRNGLGYTWDSQEDRQSWRLFSGLIWESLLSDNIVFRSQIGYTTLPENIYPKRCVSEPITCDHIPAVQQNYPVVQVFDNDIQHRRTDNYIIQFRNRIEWFVNSRGFGEHSLTLHDFFYSDEVVTRTSRPGDQLLEWNGQTKQQLTYYYSNDPRYEAPRYGWFMTDRTAIRHMTTLSDSWRLTRYLTLIPAMTHVWATGSNSSGDKIVDQNALAPSVALAWDATHDGRTVVRSSFNTYVDVDVQALTDHTLRTQTSYRCQYNPANDQFDQNCTYSGGLSRNTFGLPCGTNGLNADGTTCRNSLSIPRTWEYTFGGEREVIQGVAISADLVYRKFLQPYERLETNRVWNRSGTALEPTGGFRNGRNETILDLETPNDAQWRYAGVTMGIKKREGQLKIFTYYTLSVMEGNAASSLDGSYGAIPPQNDYRWGYLPNDHRHELKTTAVYQATKWLMFGFRYDYISGFPYNHWYRNDVTGGFDDLRAFRGTNPSANVNDPTTNRELRLPDRQSFNVQARVNWMPLIGQRLETYVDVLNVLALRTVTGVNQNDGPAWGTPNGSRFAPMQIRLNLNYRY